MLKGRTPLTERPGSYLKPIDLEAERKKVADEVGMAIDDYRLASYLMYPKVYTDFEKTQDRYGPTEVLPTRSISTASTRATNCSSTSRRARPWS